ncbi:MAG: hypothetical protein K0S46_2108 [Moraxellaceae bacterium]|jgi:hypothetical protein|nr:hypothetical protein [Moraxellaceae bacterium]
MKFNICYMGPEHLFHLRRDFFLVLKYALEDLGHDVILSGPSLDTQRFNLIVGAYFLPSEQIAKIAAAGVKFAHVNTEVISNDMLNFNPDKVDFLGAYLPSMKQGGFVWDVIMDNMAEYDRYGVNAQFLRWGWHPKMQDIEHKPEKDLDFYFFGMISQRRRALLQALAAAGLRGAADHSCPYFVRNSNIGRAKVQLNLIQEDKYTHVNSFRICYLANNACCILSENEKDPANYLKYADVVDPKELVARVQDCVAGDRWRQRGEKALADFREYDMRETMAALLDRSFTA